MKGHGQGAPTAPVAEHPGRVPPQALLIAVAALAVPLVATVWNPGWVTRTEASIVWLLPVLPAFLLSYYRGWKGATVALAVGMATLSLSVVLFDLGEVEPPRPEVYLLAISALIVVALGSGTLASAFQKSLQRAELRALTDQTTGLPNRRYGVLALDRAFAGAKRGRALAVALFDLDHFKEVNDTYGHAVGDQALRAFAAILEENTRAMHVSARYGGEEFVTVMEDTDPEDARIFAERVRRELEEGSGPWGTLTVSAGVAGYEEGMASPDVLLAAADQALYRAKAAGRNRVEVTGRKGGRDRRPARAPAVEEGIRYEGARILVVDDDEATVNTLGNVLRRAGFSVLESSDPRRALNIVRGLAEPVDLVLTDIMMPSMSGFTLVEILSEERPPGGVIYMSGYEQEEVDWAGVPGDHTAFLSKPVELKVLLETIEDVLRDAGQARPTPPSPPGDEGARERVEEPSPGGVGPHPTTLRGEEARDPSRLPVLVGADGPAALPVGAIREAGFRPARVVATELAPEEAEFGLLLVVGPLTASEQTELATVLEGARGLPPILVWWGAPEERSSALDGWLVEELSTRDGERLTRSLVRLRARARRLREAVTGPGAVRDPEAVVAARTAELEEARDDMVLRLARAAEYRDDLTGEHALRVGRFAALLGEELGLTTEECELLEEAAPLHDVGKIAIPDSILRKPGKLTPTEREVMERHTEVGAHLLSGSASRLLQVAAKIAHRHHERWDGSGYPDGLAAEEIPLAARIVAVADVFDSLTHLRPYRDAAPIAEVIEELRAEAGRHFDPAVVEAFERIAEAGRLGEVEEAASVVARPDRQGPERSP